MNVVEREELAVVLVIVQSDLGIRFSDTQQLCERVKLRLITIANSNFSGDVQAAIQAWDFVGVELIVVQQKTGRPVAVNVSRALAGLVYTALLDVPIGFWVNYKWYYRYLLRENAYYYPGSLGKAIVTHKGRHEVADRVYRDSNDVVAVAAALGVSRSTAEYYLRDFRS